jgi:hypothetical protein
MKDEPYKSMSRGHKFTMINTNLHSTVTLDHRSGRIEKTEELRHNYTLIPKMYDSFYSNNKLCHVYVECIINLFSNDIAKVDGDRYCAN